MIKLNIIGAIIPFILGLVICALSIGIYASIQNNPEFSAIFKEGECRPYRLLLNGQYYNVELCYSNKVYFKIDVRDIGDQVKRNPSYYGVPTIFDTLITAYDIEQWRIKVGAQEDSLLIDSILSSTKK